MNWKSERTSVKHGFCFREGSSLKEVKVGITAHTLLEIENVTIAGVADEFINGAVALLIVVGLKGGGIKKEVMSH